MMKLPEAAMLVFAPHGRNAAVLAGVLERGGVKAIVCEAAAELTRRLGPASGGVLVTEAGLVLGGADALTVYQLEEPIWSEVPIVVLARRTARTLGPVRNATILQQPSTARQVLTTVRLALLVRAQQHELRDLLLEVEQRQGQLKALLGRAAGANTTLEQALGRVQLRLVEERERDRRAIARELHDVTIQRLVALNFAVANAQRVAAEGNPERLHDLLAELREELLAGLSELRRFIREFRPTGIELGFENALASTLPQVAAGPAITLDVGAAEGLPEDVALCLLRVAQEAVRNALRHAGAREVRVTIAREGGEIHLEVSDDGRGFEVPEHLAELVLADHFGIVGIQEFVAGLGGRLLIGSVLGGGTRVSARLPIGAAGAS